jgi:hypothetical protein
LAVRKLSLRGGSCPSKLGAPLGGGWGRCLLLEDIGVTMEDLLQIGVGLDSTDADLRDM